MARVRGAMRIACLSKLSYINVGQVKNMIGGILLFPKTLEEDAGHIYEMSDNLPVAYASNNVNTTANAARGSLNQTESKVLENG